MLKPDIKTIKPHLIALAIFIVLAFAYANPVMSGKQLTQDDKKGWIGMSKEVTDYMEKTGENPMWTNSMFGGMPAYQITGHNGKNYTSFLKYPRGPFPVNQLILMMLCAYILLMSFGLTPWLSIVGSFAFAFSTNNIILMDAGHETKALAIAYAPLILAGINYLFKKRYLPGAALTAAGMTLELSANHVQITYYVGIIIIIWGLFKLYDAYKMKELPHFFKAVSIAAVCALMGFGTQATNLVLTKEYSKYSNRGTNELTITPDGRPSTEPKEGLDHDYAFQWSNGTQEIPTILIPNFAGSGHQNNLAEGSELHKWLKERNAGNELENVKGWVYWGELPFTEGPTYIGAIICFLFVLGMFIVKSNLRWWLLSASIISVILTLGKHLPGINFFIFDNFPLFNKFRAPDMAIIIAQLCFGIMAGLALKEVFMGKVKKEEFKKSLLYSFYITGGICAFYVLFAGSLGYSGAGDANLAKQYGDDLIRALKADRASLLRMDALRSLFFISLVFGVIWFYIKGTLKQTMAIAAIGAAILLDFWFVDKRYLDNDDFKTVKGEYKFEPNEVDLEILKDTSYYRVLDMAPSEGNQNPFSSSRAAYFHHSVLGYHPAKLRRYQDVIDWYLSDPSKNYQAYIRVLHMLNTKYLIQANKETGQPQQAVNPYALGPAWLVERDSIVNNPDDEITALGNFDPMYTAIVDKRFADQLEGFKMTPDTTAYIKLLSYKPNQLEYEFNSKYEQVAVFSEIYYDKGWNAYIDNEPHEYFRCNYILRGMRIPAGNHKITFKFEPETFDKVEPISRGSQILVIALILLAVTNSFFPLKKLINKKTEANRERDE